MKGFFLHKAYFDYVWPVANQRTIRCGPAWGGIRLRSNLTVRLRKDLSHVHLFALAPRPGPVPFLTIHSTSHLDRSTGDLARACGRRAAPLPTGMGEEREGGPSKRASARQSFPMSSRSAKQTTLISSPAGRAQSP